MTVFTRLCRFMDWDLSATGYVRSGAWSITSGLLIVNLPIPFVSRPYGVLEMLVIAMVVGLALAWFAFVAWRGWRLLRASGARGDRAYDRHGKFDLPSEYAASESATRATRRRKKRIKS
jgi:hypothetical protein